VRSLTISDPALVGRFDPLKAIPWHSVFWAGDPAWSNPGDGNAVTTWRDGSGNGRDLGGSGATRPLFRASVAALNNRPAVQGDGVDDLLSVTFTSVPQPYSLVVVASMAGGTFPAAVGGGAATNGSDMVLVYRSTSGYFKMFAGSADVGPTSGDANPHAFRAHFNGASSALAVGSSVTSGSPGTRAIARLNVCGTPYTAANVKSSGHVAFVGLVAGDVTAASNWAALSAWIAAHYAVTAPA
jgi:hypothetical protein